MARFIGTPEEFYDLFGSSLLTKAVQVYTTEYRKMVGLCERKGKKEITCSGTLHAAHVKGTSRKTIAMDILRAKRDENGLVNIRIDEFLSEFYEAHLPLHEHFRVLCSAHHGDYDKGSREHCFENRKTRYGMPKGKQKAAGKYLVTFDPSIEVVLTALNENGLCHIHYHFADGTIISKPWRNKTGAIAEDNILSNIQSKSFLRTHKAMIAGIKVSITPLHDD